MDLSRYDLKFSLFGIPIRIMLSFWILCIFFSPFLQGFRGRTSWLFGLLGWTLAMTISFLAHELGHALAARFLTDAKPRIDLGVGQTTGGAVVFGGAASWIPTYKTTYKTQALVSVAGPLTPLLCSVLFIATALCCGCRLALTSGWGPIPLLLPMEWIGLIQTDTPVGLFFGFFTYGFLWISVVWGILNLVPVFPLDGGQLLLVMLGKDGNRRGVKTAMTISTLCASVFGLLFFSSQSYFATFFFFYLAYRSYRLTPK